MPPVNRLTRLLQYLLLTADCLQRNKCMIQLFNVSRLLESAEASMKIRVLHYIDGKLTGICLFQFQFIVSLGFSL